MCFSTHFMHFAWVPQCLSPWELTESLPWETDLSATSLLCFGATGATGRQVVSGGLVAPHNPRPCEWWCQKEMDEKNKGRGSRGTCGDWKDKKSLEHSWNAEGVCAPWMLCEKCLASQAGSSSRYRLSQGDFLANSYEENRSEILVLLTVPPWTLMEHILPRNTLGSLMWVEKHCDCLVTKNIDLEREKYFSLNKLSIGVTAVQWRLSRTAGFQLSFCSPSYWFLASVFWP